VATLCANDDLLRAIEVVLDAANGPKIGFFSRSHIFLANRQHMAYSRPQWL
jgi:hypothetical protein